MYYVIVLESQKDGRYYIGATAEIEDQLKRHNAGETRSTRPFLPYKIVYTEAFSNLAEARRREIASIYNKELSKIDTVILPVERPYVK